MSDPVPFPARSSGGPGRGRGWAWVAWLVLSLLATPGAADEDSALSLADLDAYRVALGAKPAATAAPVRFRDLWDRPGAYVGRRVRVEGRVARLFRQPRLGEFPPLGEAWIVSPVGDPSCLVFPLPEGRPTPEVGAPVRFTGTFLKRLRYQGGDAARLAPLIVGPEAPTDSSPTAPRWSTFDWILGLGAAWVVASMLARRHLARPPWPPASLDPPPRFIDGAAGPDLDDAAEEGSTHEDPR